MTSVQIIVLYACSLITLAKISKTIHHHLRQGIPNNMKWIHKMSSCLLKKKKLDLIVYLMELLKPDFHFDEIAIMIHARMYQLHIGVVLKDHYWSTHHEQTMEHFKQSDIILTYFGNLIFKDTVVHKITSETYHCLTTLNSLHF